MAKRFANLIDGQWVDGAAVSENRNPSDTDEVVGEFAQGTAADVDRAVDAARAALPGWIKSNAQVRGDMLDKVCDLLTARADELGELLAREEGKTLAEAKGEVMRAARIFRFYSGECYRAIGDVLPSHAHRHHRRGATRADRRGRPDHPVELPHRHPRLEGRPGAGLRQLRW